MSNIAIATITIVENNENAYNYGNKLQMFALQEYLRMQGHFCETIKYRFTPPEYLIDKEETEKKISFRQLFDDIFRILGRILHRKELSGKAYKRKKAFDSFICKHIVFTPQLYTDQSDFTSLGKKYDYYITGSDQVWNPYCEGSNAFYYLTFAPKNKRIAYAPSIAVGHIPDEIKKQYKKWIRDIPKLSVREDAGKKLLHEEFAVEAELVCDPVFLLEKSQWSSIALKRDNTEEYFVTYFLGKKTVDTKQKIKKLQKITGLKYMDIYSRDDVSSEFAGPECFLGLIENAKFVCTDSFHGTAFSVIFEKPMIIFERDDSQKMNSRIDSLLRICKVTGRSVENILRNPETLYNIDYSKNNVLRELIHNSKQFLNSALYGTSK